MALAYNNLGCLKLSKIGATRKTTTSVADNNDEMLAYWSSSSSSNFSNNAAADASRYPDVTAAAPYIVPITENTDSNQSATSHWLSSYSC